MSTNILMYLLWMCLVLSLCGDVTPGQSLTGAPSGLSECNFTQELLFSPECVEVLRAYHDPTHTLCTENLSEEAVERIDRLFVSGKRADLSYYTGDFYFNVTEDHAYFRITYLSAKTDLLDSVGYFRYSWDLRKPVYAESGEGYLGVPIYHLLSRVHDKCYPAGRSLQIGPFDRGDTIGLYLASDSFGKSLDYANRHSEYSISPPMRDRYSHLVTWVYMPSIGRYVVGFDAGAGCDRDYDYNDVVVLLELDSLKMKTPEPVIYERGRLHLCAETKHSVDAFRHSRDGYVYTLLLNETETDCLFARTPPPGWNWAPYEEESHRLLEGAMQTTWARYRGATFAFLNGNGSLVLVHPNSTASASDAGSLPDGAKNCIWIDCDAIAVVRKPAEGSNFYSCNVVSHIAVTIQPADEPLSVSFRSMHIKVPGHLELSHRLPDFELISPPAPSYRFKLYYLIDLDSNLAPLFENNCSRYLRSDVSFELSLEPISVFLHRDETCLGAPKALKVGSFRQLQNTVRAVYKLLGHGGRKGVDAHTNLLGLASQIILDSFDEPAMCQLVVITDRPWSETDEGEFVGLVRESSIKVIFASTEERSRQRELASTSSVLIDYYVADKSSPCEFWNGLFDAVRSRMMVASIYVVDKGYEDLFFFGEKSMLTAPGGRYRVRGSLVWSTRRARTGRTPVLQVGIAVSGWRGSMKLVTIEYNVPPTGRNMSVRANAQVYGINLALEDLNKNPVSVRISKVPASGVLLNSVTMRPLKDGDMLYGEQIALPTSTSTELLLYNKSVNGEYQLRYALHDGCVWSEDYVVNITAETPNSRIGALDVLYKIPPNTYLSNATGFNLSSSVDDVDPYGPIFVRFTRLPDPLSQGTLHHGKDKVLVSSLRDQVIGAGDALYYVPSMRFGSNGRQEGRFRRERVAEFYLEESSAANNVSNIAFLTVELDTSKEPPRLALPYGEVKVSRATGRVNFEVVLEDYEGSMLDLCVSSLGEGSSILEGDRVLAAGPIRSDTVIKSELKIADTGTSQLVMNLTWATSADLGSSQRGVFHLWRSARGGQVDRSADLALGVTVVDFSDYSLPRAYNSEVGVSHPGRPVVFSIMGITQGSETVVTVDDYRFGVASMPEFGRLYRKSDYSPLRANVPIAADGPYELVGSPTHHGAEVSLFYVAGPWDSECGELECEDSMEYFVFNGLARSERRVVVFRIRRAEVELKSKDLSVFMLESEIYAQAVQLEFLEVCREGYLNVTGVDSSGLHIGDAEMLREGSVVRVDSQVDYLAYVRFVGMGSHYSYWPGEDPKRAAIVQFQACCGDVCRGDYGISVYVQHTPHAPRAEDCDKTVVRMEVQEVALPVTDVDEYDQGRLRVTLIALSRPVRGRLYVDRNMMGPIDTSGSSIELSTTRFYYYSDALHGKDVDLPLDTFVYTATDTTELSSNQARLNLYVGLHADAPVTSLARASVDQGSSVVIRLASRRYMRFEWYMSRVTVTILSLPRVGELFDCIDYACLKKVPIKSVPYDLVGENSGAAVMYSAPSGKWGKAYASLEYKLTDATSAATSENRLLPIDIWRVNEGPKIEFLNKSFPPAVLVEQTTWHDFIWRATDSDDLPEKLYTILVVNMDGNQNWSLHRCLDEACSGSEPYVLRRESDALEFILPPTKVFNSGCATFGSLLALNGNFDECYALFRYRFYPDSDALETTFTYFSLAASDSSSTGRIHVVSLTSLKVNRPPSIWAPAKIVWTGGVGKNVPIRDNAVYSSSLNQGVTLYDLGADPQCKEKLAITSDTPGVFNLPREAINCETSSQSSLAAVVVECTDTLNSMNSWLPRLSFRPDVSASHVNLNFSLSDLGCSSDSNDDVAYTSSVVSTEIVISDLETPPPNLLGIVSASSMLAYMVLLAGLAYVFRRYLSPPIQDYYRSIVDRDILVSSNGSM